MMHQPAPRPTSHPHHCHWSGQSASAPPAAVPAAAPAALHVTPLEPPKGGAVSTTSSVFRTPVVQNSLSSLKKKKQFCSLSVYIDLYICGTKRQQAFEIGAPPLPVDRTPFFPYEVVIIGSLIWGKWPGRGYLKVPSLIHGMLTILCCRD